MLAVRRENKRLSLNGAHAVVTGASSGIGLAAAKALAKRGARIAIVARRTAELEALSDQIEADGLIRPIVLTADLSKRGEADRIGNEALHHLGSVDLVINNAAMHILQSLADTDGDKGRQIYETNVWSPLELIKVLLPSLAASERGGAIANVTSAAGYMTPALHGVYASSKAAISAATDILRMEVRPQGVSVTEIVPGPIDTKMLDGSRDAPFARIALRLLPVGTPENMAQSLLHAVEVRRRRIIFPSHTVVPVVLPGLGKLFMRSVAKWEESAA
jgi:short-subunit dehydrogenase